MTRNRLTSILFASLTACSGAGAAPDPEALATELQKALKAGDFSQAGLLANIHVATPLLQRQYFAMVSSCSFEHECTVSTAPLDDQFAAKIKSAVEQDGVEAITADGLLVVAMSSADGKSSGRLKMPYRNQDGGYRIVQLPLSAAEMTRRRATTAEDMLEEMLLDYKSLLPESGVTVLPADGGAPGQALLIYSQVMVSAIDKQDPDAALQASPGYDKHRFTATTSEGTPIPLDVRKRRLYVESLDTLRQVNISGGTLAGERAFVMFEARNGLGWVERGVQMMYLDDGSWQPVRIRQSVSYPQ